MTILRVEILGSTRDMRATGQSKIKFFFDTGGYFFDLAVRFFWLFVAVTIRVSFHANTTPLLTWYPFVSRCAHPPELNLPSPRSAPIPQLNWYLLTRAHACTFFLSDGVPYHLPHRPHSGSRSLSLRSTPPPSAHAIKPTSHPFCTLTHWSSSTYKLAIIPLIFF